MNAEERFKALYLDNGDAVVGYCVRRLGVDDGNDAAADVFVTAWRRIDVCPQGDEARLWLFGVARRVVANKRRSVARRTTLLHRITNQRLEPVTGPEAITVRNSEYDEVMAAIEKLPDKYREVVILSEWDGLDREEIAELHGVKRSAIDQRMSRAYKKLERLLRHRITDNVLFNVPHAIKEGGEA